MTHSIDMRSATISLIPLNYCKIACGFDNKKNITSRFKLTNSIIVTCESIPCNKTIGVLYRRNFRRRPFKASFQTECVAIDLCAVH